MGTCSYVLTGTEQGMQETFGSTCHGAVSIVRWFHMFSFMMLSFFVAVRSTVRYDPTDVLWLWLPCSMNE